MSTKQKPLGQIAYEMACRIDAKKEGLDLDRCPEWDDLSSKTREYYSGIAQAVQSADRKRLRRTGELP